MSGVCVTVTPTIGDGTVVRWYASEAAMDYMQPTISASRNGVLGHGGDYISGEVFTAAWAAHQRLAQGLDVDDLATHRRHGLMGPYERITDRRAGTPASTTTDTEIKEN